jgi:hypothetical protein
MVEMQWNRDAFGTNAALELKVIENYRSLEETLANVFSSKYRYWLGCGIHTVNASG